MDHVGSLHIQVFSFGLLVLVAHFMGKITYHLNFGELIGQLLGGILVNPYWLSVFHVGGGQYSLAFQNFYFFTFIFLSVVAFSLGEELHFQKLKDVGSKRVVVCLVQLITTLICVTGGFLFISRLFGDDRYDLLTCLILGSIGLTTSHAATFIISNTLKLEGVLQDVLANIIVLNDLIGVLIFSLAVQFVIGQQTGGGFSIFDASLHALHGVGLAILLGLVTFLVLKAIIRKFELPGEQPGHSLSTAFRFAWNISHEHPSQPVHVMFVVLGLLSISVSFAMKFHLPVLLVPLATGICISNFHTHKLFDSLKREEISSFFNLMFFALIGANIHIKAIYSDTIGYVLVYIVTRSIGKLFGTRLGATFSKQDVNIRRCLPKLMLPQAGIAAVEVAYVAIVLTNRGNLVNVILPALLFFEIAGVILSEKTLRQWKSWTIGEEAILRHHLTGKPTVHQATTIRLGSILCDELTKIPLRATKKEKVILELLGLFKDTGKITDTETVYHSIMSREKLMSTGIGGGVAILQGKTTETKEVLCAFGTQPKGVDFKSIDGQPADIFFLIVAPENEPALHLKFLATIFHILKSDKHQKRIREFSSPQDAMAFFAMIENDGKIREHEGGL